MFITLCLLALYIYIHTHIYTNMLITLCLLALCVILGPLDIMKYLRELTGETDDQLKALTTLDLSGTHSALPTTNTALSLTHYPSTQQQRSPVTSDPHAYRMLTILSTLTRTRTKTFNPSQNTNSDPNTTPLCSHQRSTHRPYRTLTIMSALMRIITILHNPSPNTYKLCVVSICVAINPDLHPNYNKHTQHADPNVQFLSLPELHPRVIQLPICVSIDH